MQKNEEKKFNALYKKYVKIIYSVLNKFNGDTDLIDQEKFWKALTSYSESKGSKISTHLFANVRYSILDELKKQRKYLRKTSIVHSVHYLEMGEAFDRLGYEKIADRKGLEDKFEDQLPLLENQEEYKQYQIDFLISTILNLSKNKKGSIPEWKINFFKDYFGLFTTKKLSKTELEKKYNLSSTQYIYMMRVFRNNLKKYPNEEIRKLLNMRERHRL